MTDTDAAIQQAWTHMGLKDRRLKHYRLSSRMRKVIPSQPMLLAARSALLYGVAVAWCPGRTARSHDPAGDLGVATDTCRPAVLLETIVARERPGDRDHLR